MQLFSIARLAAEFGMSRETVSKRLAQANVVPDGRRSGHPVYRLRDAVPALFDVSGRGSAGTMDPDSLPPEQRRAWFQSEQARIAVMEKARQLIPAAEVETEMANLCKRVVQWIDTLPDQMERDAGLTPAQVDALHASAMRLRGVLYVTLVEDASNDAATATYCDPVR